jgi:hypothetical protein
MTVRALEFFIDESERLSMSRLLLFASFFVASWIVIIDTYNNGAKEGIFAIYISAYTGAYVCGKWAERKWQTQSHAAQSVEKNTMPPRGAAFPDRETE